MRKNIYILFFIPTLMLINTLIVAQSIGINTTGNAPDASAILDISSSTKGLLIPNVSLTALNAASPLTSPATSLLVYNTNASITYGKGYYYNAGTPGSPNWVKILTNGTYSSGWLTIGNSSTASWPTMPYNYLGTTDAQDLVFKVNSIMRMKLLERAYIYLYSDYGKTTSVGYAAGSSVLKSGADSAERNVFLGYNAGASTTYGDDNVFLGNQSGYANTTGSGTVLVGSYAGYNAGANGVCDSNTFIGYKAGYWPTHASTALGNQNTFIGTFAGYSSAGSSGYQNTFIGSASGAAYTTGYRNTFMGAYSGTSLTTGNDNVFFGNRAGNSITTNSSNTLLGAYAGAGTDIASGFCTFLGYASGMGTSGVNNTLIGALATAPSGKHDVVAIGYNASAGGNNSIAIGTNASVTTDNTIILGTTSTAGVGIGSGSTTNALLQVGGDMVLKRNSATLTSGTFDNYSASSKSIIIITAATGAFAFTGFTDGQPGKILIVINETAQNMTISNSAGTSSAGNRILTGTGANIATAGIGAFTMIYSGTAGSGTWYVTAYAQ